MAAENLRDVKDTFILNTSQATATTGLIDTIIDITSTGIEDIIKNSHPNHSTKNSLENHVIMVRNLKQSPIIFDSAKTIYLQQLILIFSAFETYLSDTVRVIGNDYRGFLIWPDGKPGSIDVNFLSSQTTTIGDLVLAVIEKRSISFQDLKSTKEFFEKYLGINIVFKEEDLLILTAAIRHAAVHNGAIVDHKFIQQIRNTHYASDYKHGQKIEVDQKFIRNIMICFQSAGNEVYKALEKQLSKG
jgi:hypothetical protein